MQKDQHLYLFTLEITPLKVGKTYNPLPSHLTLMSRFWSELSPDEIAKIVKPLFDCAGPIELIFGEPAQLGPKKIDVHLVKPNKSLKKLHDELHNLLDAANVTYEYPRFVGEGHKPHVSKREDDQFRAGHKQIANAAYLIEVAIKGDKHLRFIQARFELNI